jgi:hypothetical protein
MPPFLLRIVLKRRDSRSRKKMCRHCAADRGGCQGSRKRLAEGAAIEGVIKK